MKQTKKPPLIVILGTNASGKSDLAIKLAKRFNGEIVSADSRQVYKGLDIGSGKVTKKEQRMIPHHLLDVAKPGQRFSLAQYQKAAFLAIDDILKRKKIPFLVGGTGLYVKAVCENLNIPRVKPDKRLRRRLEAIDLKKLQIEYKKIDPVGYRQIDIHNRRRLIRAIEVVKATNRPFWQQRQKKEAKYNCLKLGLTFPKEILRERIEIRLKKRLKSKMVSEVRGLIKDNISHKWLLSLGLSYARVVQYLKQEMTKEEMQQAIVKDELAYAKRQMTWFKKDKKIRWLKNEKEAEKLVKKFLLS